MKTVSTKIERKNCARLLALAIVLLLFVSATPKDTFAASETLSMYKVQIERGRLAMMSRPSSDLQYGVGELENGETVIRCPSGEETNDYFYVYAPEHDQLGFVKKDSLKFFKEYNDGSAYYIVKVAKNYLALRTAKAYEWKNEIGKMYTGDSVIMLDSRDSTYWTVYSPLLKKAGYTNKNFLVKSSEYKGPTSPEKPEPVDPGASQPGSADPGTAQPESSDPLIIPENADAEWTAGKDNHLDFTFEVRNASKKTVTSFVATVYAQDSLGQRISEGLLSYTVTTNATINPGGKAYSKSVSLPYRDNISDVFAVINKCTFSDGTTWENKEITEASYTAWEIDK